MIRTITKDIQLAARAMRRSPTFAFTSVLTLALGLAATITIFAIVDAALLRSLPFTDPQDLVFVQGTLRDDRTNVRGASFLEIADWRSATGFTALAAYSTTSLNLETDEATERLVAEIVTADYFDVFRAQPLRGRVLNNGDADGVVIGEALWERRFARSETILGTRLRLSGGTMTVVGVLPVAFGGVSTNTEVWFPTTMAALIGFDDYNESRGERWMAAIGRLAPGIELQQAQQQLDAVASGLETTFPDSHTNRTGTILSLRAAYLGPTSDLLRVLLGAAAFLLLTASANVAALQLVRANSRSDEFAVRAALGAPRGRIARQILTESICLTMFASALALLLSFWVVQSLPTILPAGVLPSFATPQVDARVVLATLVLTAFVGIATGALPARRGQRAQIGSQLRSARTVEGWGGRVLRSPYQMLVVAEVAVALVLTVGGALMTTTLLAKLGVDPGFAPDRGTAFRLSLPATFDATTASSTATQIRDRLVTVPGVSAATFASDLPLRGGSAASILYLEPQGEETRTRFYVHRVADNFFDVLGVDLLAGRAFRSDDVAGSPPTAIVSEEFADRYLGGASNAVGQELWLGRSDRAAVQVVGVAAAVRWRDMTTDIAGGDSNPDVYFPHTQRPTGRMDILLRTRGDAIGVLDAVRDVVQTVVPGVPVFAVAPLAAGIQTQTANDRLAVTVLLVFGIAAVALCAIGIYGTLAFLVGRRRREIALSLALGATVQTVRNSVLSSGGRLIVAGTTFGLAAAVALRQTVATQLFGVSALDLRVIAASAVLVSGVAVIAIWFPAMRATMVSPTDALRGN